MSLYAKIKNNKVDYISDRTSIDWDIDVSEGGWVEISANPLDKRYARVGDTFKFGSQDEDLFLENQQ